MSRKGNNINNGVLENSFRILKVKMIHNQEDKFKTLEELIWAIDKYIHYYNYERVKEKLKGLSFINHRLQFPNWKLFINYPIFWC